MNSHLLTGALYAGIDIGGTKILSVVTSDQGDRLGSAVLRTPAKAAADEVTAAMANAARQAAANAGIPISRLRGVGVAAAGAIDPKSGSVMHSPHLPTFRKTPVVSMLREILDMPVVIGNDANMAALAEHHFGAGKGVSNLLFITVSTGIGGGIIIDDRLIVGANGYAGEVGHITVDGYGPYGKSSTPGAWESLCSGTALVRIVTERIQAGEPSSMASVVRSGNELTAIDVFAALRSNDPLARSVVDKAIGYMGAALTSLVNVLDPSLVIIGGGLSNEWQDYIVPAVTIMRKQAFAGMGANLPVVQPALGADAGAIGAAALAMDTGLAAAQGR